MSSEDYERTIPETGLASDRDFWKTYLDLSKKVAVYWHRGANTVDLIGYFETVSAGNSAAEANQNVMGAYPIVRINWNHTSIEHIQVGTVQYPYAQQEVPAWLDEDPKY